MYKRIIIATALVAGALQAYAQLTPQYYNNALLFSSQFYDGTARSVAMGNAMTALGGDLGALSYNPAASGVYRYTEITLTPSVYSSITNTSFLGNTMQADKSRLSISPSPPTSPTISHGAAPAAASRTHPATWAVSLRG